MAGPSHGGVCGFLRVAAKIVAVQTHSAESVGGASKLADPLQSAENLRPR